jgi:hypothetical protein
MPVSISNRAVRGNEPWMLVHRGLLLTAAPPRSVINWRLRSGRDARFIARPPHRTIRAAFPHTAPTSGV